MIEMTNFKHKNADVRLYLDESGRRDPSTPKAVVGGFLINYSHFLPFEKAWGEMLSGHGIVAPLHMSEFGRNGRFGAISVCRRRELFTEVAAVIASHKIASVSASLTNAEYERLVQPEVRAIYSPYAMCFNLAVMMNHKLAEGKYDAEVQFIIDTGNP